MTRHGRAGPTHPAVTCLFLRRDRRARGTTVATSDGSFCSSVHLRVHLVVLLGGDGRRHLVEQRVELVGVDLLTHQHHRVVGALEALVVLEQHDAVGDDAGAREQHADVDHAVGQVLRRDRSAHVELVDRRELDAVDALESEQTRLALLTLGRPTERQVTRHLGEIRQRGDVELLGALLGHVEAVDVLRRCRFGDHDSVGLRGVDQRRLRLLDVTRRSSVERRGQDGALELGIEIDLPRRQRRVDDLGSAEVLAVADVVAVGLESLPVDLAEDLRPGEVLGADCQASLVASPDDVLLSSLLLLLSSLLHAATTNANATTIAPSERPLLRSRCFLLNGFLLNMVRPSFRARDEHVTRYRNVPR